MNLDDELYKMDKELEAMRKGYWVLVILSIIGAILVIVFFSVLLYLSLVEGVSFV